MVPPMLGAGGNGGGGGGKDFTVSANPPELLDAINRGSLAVFLFVSSSFIVMPCMLFGLLPQLTLWGYFVA